MSSSFRDPAKEFRAAPFWSWNGKMEPEEVKRQVGLLHQQGFGGYFMHSRIGLETPYMGEEWMAAIAAGIEAAYEYDMEAWLYDEDKWPSGFAGGLVPEKGEAYRAKGLEARILDASSVGSLWEEEGPGFLSGPRILYKLEFDEEGGLKSFSRLEQAPSPDEAGKFLLCRGRVAIEGEEWYNGQSYVDLMDANVTQAFIECTHEPYKEAFAEHFGPNVPGIFTDEPNVATPPGPFLSPWTPSLPERFQTEWGYDLLERLPLLFLPAEGSAQVRRDYWTTITLAFRDNFSKPFGAWCEENGIAMTGHYLAEDSLVDQIRTSGAVMPHYPYMQVPGIDHLGRNIYNPLTLKQVSSVAHQMGRTRVLCEIFGVSGHSMSFADQKWIADFHFALGITFMNQHLTLYSMLGERKRDYPANISWAQPYWPHYRLFNDYAARCSWFMQRGRIAADILLVHPIASAWEIMPGRCEGVDYDAQVAGVRKLNHDFLTVFNALLEGHRDFDLGDEMVMAEYARVDGAELVVGEVRYKTVVLPYCTYLAPATQSLLRQFIEAGGKVYAVGGAVENLGLPGIQYLSEAPGLLEVLEKDLPRSISITDTADQEAASILYHHRIDGERNLFFLAHTDAEAGASVRVRVPATGEVTIFDLTSGETALLQVGKGSPFPYAAVNLIRSDKDGVELEWFVPPAGSLAFSVGDGLDPEATQPVRPTTGALYSGFSDPITKEKAREETGPWAFERLHPNVLTLDYCRYSYDGQPMSEDVKPVPAVRAEVLRACGRKTMTQPYIYLTGKLPSRAVPVTLEFTYFIDVLPKTLALVLEQPDKVQVEVNGRKATERAVDDQGQDLAYAWLQDPGFGALDIRDLSHVGENKIVLSFQASAADADVEEVYLLGDFGVWSRDGRYKIGSEPQSLQPGSWVEQGYPFYSGTMRYQLDLEGGQKDLWLDCSCAAGSLLRVFVNGDCVSELPWRPWVVNVGPHMHPGPNRVEVEVVSSLRNAFGPLHHKLGDKIPWVGPGQFTVSADHWTDTYQFAPYGLLAPVRLLTGE